MHLKAGLRLLTSKPYQGFLKLKKKNTHVVAKITKHGKGLDCLNGVFFVDLDECFGSSNTKNLAK